MSIFGIKKNEHGGGSLVPVETDNGGSGGFEPDAIIRYGDTESGYEIIGADFETLFALRFEKPIFVLVQLDNVTHVVDCVDVGGSGINLYYNDTTPNYNLRYCFKLNRNNEVEREQVSSKSLYIKSSSDEMFEITVSSDGVLSATKVM